MKKASAILVADIHLRDDTPVCRTDDFWKAMTRKLIFLKEQQKKHKCTVISAGDVFHKAKSSPYLQALAIRELPESFYSIPGQHDLPSHVLNLFEKASMEVLNASDKVTPLLNSEEYFEFKEFFLRGFPFGVKFEDNKDLMKNESKKTVAVLHDMIYKDKPIHKSIASTKGLSLLKNSSYDLIVTGDNHQPFTVEYEGRLLVNCGSMMRTEASQADYKPCLWLWYAETNEVEPVYFPIEEGVVNRGHLDIKEVKDARLESFINRVQSDYKIGFSFTDNLKSHFKKNKTRKGISDKIYNSIGRD